MARDGGAGEEARSIRVGSDTIPCSVRHPPAAPRGVVLLGHGLGVDRFDETVLVPSRLLADDFGFVVVCPELPLHGERAKRSHTSGDIARAWHEYWAGGGWRELLVEWGAVQSQSQLWFPDVPVVYFGLSLGTQYGILFLSKAKGVRAAVLGLFGSEPPPRSIVMNECAPKVCVPTYFIQKLDDEIHPAENARHLFASLGTSEKVLDASSGAHREVSLESLREAGRFLSQHV